MTRKRRSFFIIFLLSVTVSFPLLVRAEDTSSGPPESAFLQAGDLIWPKKPGAVVPYNSRPGEAGENDATRWRDDKEAYLKQVRSEPSPSPQEKERYSALQKMTYEEFVSSYLADRPAGQPATFGVGDLSVGHVGIIDIADGMPFVVEAIMGLGVRRISYADWLRDHRGDLIWLGRLKNVPPEKRSAVLKTAAEQVGKPYDFWDFNLKDTSGFCCSKLAWLSVSLGAGFPPDDDPNPERILWYSPKQLMKSKHIDLIVNPKPY